VGYSWGTSGDLLTLILQQVHINDNAKDIPHLVRDIFHQFSTSLLVKPNYPLVIVHTNVDSATLCICISTPSGPLLLDVSKSRQKRSGSPHRAVVLKSTTLKTLFATSGTRPSRILCVQYSGFRSSYIFILSLKSLLKNLHDNRRQTERNKLA